MHDWNGSGWVGNEIIWRPAVAWERQWAKGARLPVVLTWERQWAKGIKNGLDPSPSYIPFRCVSPFRDLFRFKFLGEEQEKNRRTVTCIRARDRIDARQQRPMLVIHWTCVKEIPLNPTNDDRAWDFATELACQSHIWAAQGPAQRPINFISNRYSYKKSFFFFFL